MSREGRKDTPFVDFAAGETILHEGETASALFIIEAGKVVIERSDAPGVELAELGPGEFFGEMSILQEQPHSANATARTAVRALRIDVAAFHAVLRENVEVAVHMMRRLVLRLRATEQRRLELESQLAHAAAAPAASKSKAPPSSAPAVASPPAAAAAAAPPPPPAAPPQAAAAPPQPADATATPEFQLRHAEGSVQIPAGKDDCLIGRPDPATGAIPEINLGPLDHARSLSRRHARLHQAGGTVTLSEEPGVSNGTWVNGERLAAGQKVVLKSGDKLRFGAIELEFGAS
jgi:predicted component of type VI protein secretion system